jgi:N-acetylglucosamine-6-phosphate deacetylase
MNPMDHPVPSHEPTRGDSRAPQTRPPQAKRSADADCGPVTGLMLTPQGFVRGRMHIHQGRIDRIDGDLINEAQALNEAERLPLILPGFIDLHVHGGGGHDTMDGDDAIHHITRAHVRHGTTALLATTMTAPEGDIRKALTALRPACEMPSPEGSRVLGVHLEGPFLSPQQLGAQPDFTRAATLAEVMALHALAPLRLITLAPEVPGHLPLIAELCQAGFRVQIGHSQGLYEDGVAALAQGASSFTHLFNAMSGMHHRAPGMVGAALAHAERAEIIPDLVHVHPGALRAALRAIPCLYCVTDSTAAAGMPDGEYRLGRQRVFKCMGGVRLSDGTLAGSSLTMDQALRNLVGLGLPLLEASRRVSTFAAQHLGLPDRGELKAGAWADCVALDARLEVQQVWVEGQIKVP